MEQLSDGEKKQKTRDDEVKDEENLDTLDQLPKIRFTTTVRYDALRTSTTTVTLVVVAAAATITTAAAASSTLTC